MNRLADLSTRLESVSVSKRLPTFLWNCLYGPLDRLVEVCSDRVADVFIVQ
jgi:hypothetical protein